jgi:DMSO/TMAO reductase YedYZ molybdopterin-dependent catalytic subunit
MDEVIVSPDTRRPTRLPPGQRRGLTVPAGHAGEVPPFDPSSWTLAVFPKPLADRVLTLTWAEFQCLPRAKVFADYHCVSGVSVLDNLWEGVPTRALLGRVRVHEGVRFVMAHAEYGVSTALPLADFFAEDAVLATRHNGEPLPPAAGGPVRLVVPQRYGYKSLMWVRGVELMADDRPGFYELPENGGHHRRGDPWRQERFG